MRFQSCTSTSSDSSISQDDESPSKKEILERLQSYARRPKPLIPCTDRRYRRESHYDESSSRLRPKVRRYIQRALKKMPAIRHNSTGGRRTRGPGFFASLFINGDHHYNLERLTVADLRPNTHADSDDEEDSDRERTSNLPAYGHRKPHFHLLQASTVTAPSITLTTPSTVKIPEQVYQAKQAETSIYDENEKLREGHVVPPQLITGGHLRKSGRDTRRAYWRDELPSSVRLQRQPKTPLTARSSTSLQTSGDDADVEPFSLDDDGADEDAEILSLGKNGVSDLSDQDKQSVDVGATKGIGTETGVTQDHQNETAGSDKGEKGRGRPAQRKKEGSSVVRGGANADNSDSWKRRGRSRGPRKLGSKD